MTRLIHWISGAMVGAPFAAVLADRYGRRKGMFGGAIVILVGMIIAATAKTIGQVRWNLYSSLSLRPQLRAIE